MSEEWLRLDPGEEIEWESRPRLLRAAPGVVASLALAVLAVGGATLGDPVALAALLLAPLPGAYAYLRVVNTRFVVTNRSLYRKRGLLGIDVRMVELEKIQNTRSKQGVFGTLFGHGTAEIEVAGGRDLRFYDVYDPDDVRRLVERLGSARGTIPGTVAQWKMVREELREIQRLVENRPK